MKVQGSEKRSGVKLMVILKDSASAAVGDDAGAGSVGGVESILRIVFPGMLRCVGRVCAAQVL